MGYKGTKFRSTLCKCKQCKKDFYEYKSRIEDGRGIFCSKECQYKWESNSVKFSNSVRDGVLKLYKQDKTYRNRISIGTKLAMQRPEVKEKIKNRPILKGINNPCYKEKLKHSSGYILVHNNGETILEHRLITEKIINRKLLKEEVIHHLNLDKENNSISNLLLFSNQSEHAKFHDLAYKFILSENLLDSYINFFIKNGGKCVRITR